MLCMIMCKKDYLKKLSHYQTNTLCYESGHVSFAVTMCLLKIYPCDMLFKKHEINADIVATPKNTLGNHYRKLASL